MRSKDIQSLIKDATKQGWVITPTNKGHYKWSSPLGRFFFSSSSPSDHRALQNLKRDLLRYGFIEIQKKGKK
jgi:hypothetical protein